MTKAPLVHSEAQLWRRGWRIKGKAAQLQWSALYKLSIPAVDSDPNSHKILFPITVIYSMLRVSAVDKTCGRNLKYIIFWPFSVT